MGIEYFRFLGLHMKEWRMGEEMSSDSDKGSVGWEGIEHFRF